MLRPFLFAALALAASDPKPVGIDLTPQTRNTSTSTACTSTHIIIARASSERPSQGIIGTLATKISAVIANTSVEWIPYPALLAPYDYSSHKGVEMTKAAVRKYVDGCADTKIVLLGYSQGAQVVEDVMCGGGGAIGLGPWTEKLEDKYEDRIKAVVMMGNPRFVVGVGYDAGTITTTGITVSGLFPRMGNISCDGEVGAKMESFCDVGDPYCARGADLNVHLTYTDRYNDVAFDFVKGKLDTNTPQQTHNETAITDTVTTTTISSLTSNTSSTTSSKTSSSSASKPSTQSTNDGGRQTTTNVGAPLALVVIVLFSVLA